VKCRVIVKQGENGIFVAECPALPGCISQGKTRTEALENIKDAIAGYVESLRKHDEPIPLAEDREQSQEIEAEKLPEIRCLDCGAELEPDDDWCPCCGSKNRLFAVFERLNLYEIGVLTQKERKFKKFKVKDKRGEKVARRTGRPAKEFDVYDKDRNLRCHIVAEQNESGAWELVHFHMGPLDQSKPHQPSEAKGTMPYEADHRTTKHVVFRSKDPPYRRLTVPHGPLGIGCARTLFSHANLDPDIFAELLLAAELI